ncbi:MAG: LPS-assembly protein LptD [Roseinatronobacter sp.]
MTGANPRRRRRGARPAVVALAALLLTVAPFGPRSGALAQSERADTPRFATLVADRLFITDGSVLIAEGSVEALFGTTRLQAPRIRFDRSTGALSIDGPMVLNDGRELIVLADQAELSTDLRRGLIRSARVVFDEQLQIAAAQVERLDDRFTEMQSVVASSCEICADQQTPLWEIRARRVVHDDEAQQIHFENAQFRLFGLPVLFIPRLRVPDPRLTRATGFLSPQFSINTGHGVGLRTPYFIVLGGDRDLTVTPFLGTRGTRALELRYRQAFATGQIELGTLVARDSIRPGATRALARAEGMFALGQGFDLGFDVIRLSDRRVLEDYADGEARVTSDITLERVRRDERIRAEALAFRSLRLEDVNVNLPSRAAQAVFERRMDMPGLGGVAGFRLEAHLHQRRRGGVGGSDIASPEPLPGFGSVLQPRDVARLSLDLDWRRDTVLPGGLILGLGTHIGFDRTMLSDTGGVFPNAVSRLTPAAVAELRWPLVQTGSSGASHLIEPVVQVIWSRDPGRPVPNEESRMPELDEGNLFGLNRFPGRDQREAGLRANLGISWTRHDPDGWSSTLTLGRVWRQRDLDQFSGPTPLSGQRSDWLIAASIDTLEGLSLSNRTFLGAGLNIDRTAFELDWSTETYSISTSYMRIVANPFEGRDDTSSELSFDGSRQLSDFWTGRVEWRYDIEERRADRALLGLNFTNECLRIEMGLERRFSSASAPSGRTSVGLSLDVLGVGGNPGRARRSCATL